MRLTAGLHPDPLGELHRFPTPRSNREKGVDGMGKRGNRREGRRKEEEGEGKLPTPTTGDSTILPVL